MVRMGGGGWKRIAFGGNKERFVRIKGFWFVKKLAFSAHAKPPGKEKLFTNTAKLQLRTATKLTCSHSFPISLATVSLQYNNPFSKNLSLASALQ